MGRVRKEDDPGVIDSVEELSEYEAQAVEELARVLNRRFETLGLSASTKQFLGQLYATNVSGAEQSLDWATFTDAIGELSELLSEQVRSGAEFGLPNLGVSLEGAFDYVNEYAVESAQQRAAARVVEITNEQRETLRQLIVESVSQGVTVDDTAFLIRETVGLTRRYQQAVNRSYLETKERLVAEGFPARTAQSQARRLAEQYAARLRQSRATAIARTEILSAHNEGRMLGWQQATAEGFAPTNAVKRWLVRVPPRSGGVPFTVRSGTGRTRRRVVAYDSPCELCLPFNGEAVPVDQPFSNGVMMPPLHPNCVCTAVLVIPEDAEYASL